MAGRNLTEAWSGLTSRDSGKLDWTGTVKVQESRLELPRKWQKPKRIFVTSMGDLWHPNVDDATRRLVHGIMLLCPWHRFQDLTKRPKRAAKWLDKNTPRDCIYTAWERDLCSIAQLHSAPGYWEDVGWIHRYVSVSDQPTADALIPELLRVPAAVRGISAEPLIGPVDLEKYLTRLNHVIVGGESGTGARPCRVEWIEQVLSQCRESDVPCFVKQLGSHHGPGKGDDMALWPEALRVRENAQ
jgi:protein gp37